MTTNSQNNPFGDDVVIDSESTAAVDAICKKVFCHGCGREDNIQMCTGCQSAFYCSRECQVKDWPAHKQFCKTQAAKRVAAEKEAQGIPPANPPVSSTQQISTTPHRAAPPVPPPSAELGPENSEREEDKLKTASKGSAVQNMKNFVADMHLSEKTRRTVDSIKGKTSDVSSNLVNKLRSSGVLRREHDKEVSAPYAVSSASSDMTAMVNTQVFGVSLQVAIERSAKKSPDLPDIVFKCVETIRQKGLKEEGIFRQSGAHREIQELKTAFNRGDDVDLVTVIDIHVVAGLLKLWFRELPSPLFGPNTDNPHLPPALLGVYSQLRQLDPTSLKVIRYLVELLAQVSANSSKNKMTPQNLSIVFSPTLMCSIEFFADLVSNCAALFVGFPCAAGTENLLPASEVRKSKPLPSRPPPAPRAAVSGNLIDVTFTVAPSTENSGADSRLPPAPVEESQQSESTNVQDIAPPPDIPAPI